MYYGGFAYSETYALPIIYKRWFVERIVKEINRSSDDNGATRSRAFQHNTPELRELQGMSRTQAPSRLRRFT